MIHSYPKTVMKHHVSCDYCQNSAHGYEDLDEFMSELDLAGWEFADYNARTDTIKPVLDDLKHAGLHFCSDECLRAWCKEHEVKCDHE